MTERAARAQPEATDARRARDRRFVSWLERQVPRESATGKPTGNRAVLSTLRRAAGLPPADALSVYPVLYQALNEEPLTPWEEAPYLVVAPLFALYPEGGWRSGDTTAEHQPRNFGASFARLAQSTGSASVERRFRALLDSRLVDLPEHLRHAITLLRARQIPVSWLTLLDDIRNWDHHDRLVQRRWARAYWSQTAQSNSAPTAQGHLPADQNDEEEEV